MLQEHIIGNRKQTLSVLKSDHPRVVIAGLKGASGKTFLTLGILSALRERGIEAAPFKKGPDFIDAGWLSFAAGRQCRNLDPFLMTPAQLIGSVERASGGCSISVIEGNRGLFDGLDHEGRCSSAELARILRSPVLLVIDVTMVTRTVAALVKGCQVFEKDLLIAGVILNRVANSRQESVIRRSIETYCSVPTLGGVPKLRQNSFPERHMGLIPHHEREGALQALECAREAVTRYLDLEAIRRIAGAAGPLPDKVNLEEIHGADDCLHLDERPVIGIIRDEAFWFYYPENIEVLQGLGAEIVELNALYQEKVPRLDALYIGGGFPEAMAEALSANISFRRSLAEAIEGGLPVYAECGGLMYLGEEIRSEDRLYPMVGALPIAFSLEKRPQGHGYTMLRVAAPNPFFKVGELIKGHEFHYSRPIFREGANPSFVFKAERGEGIRDGLDGIRSRNLVATYTHIHAGGTPQWASGMVKAAVAYRSAGEKGGA
jgi:cobyrinic acid a,c-diamide synthase